MKKKIAKFIGRSVLLLIVFKKKLQSVSSTQDYDVSRILQKTISFCKKQKKSVFGATADNFLPFLADFYVCWPL